MRDHPKAEQRSDKLDSSFLATDIAGTAAAIGRGLRQASCKVGIWFPLAQQHSFRVIEPEP